MKTRQLSSKWTVELKHDGEPELGESALKMLQEEIDKEVFCDMMVAVGWTKVIVSTDKAKLFDLTPSIIETWIQQNIEGKSKGMGTIWLFEHHKDAMLFTLRWS